MEILLFAFLVETIVEVTKPLFQPLVDRLPKVPITYYVSIIIGVLGALAFQVNGLELFKLSGNAIVGQVVTGLVCSRGSNFIHAIYKKLRDIMVTPEDDIELPLPEPQPEE
jgi:hypothetical protein